ncbi:MAG: hypothetical protein Kow0074_24300 [Candidatus Zixiibacteriota bacterium]
MSVKSIFIPEGSFQTKRLNPNGVPAIYAAYRGVCDRVLTGLWDWMLWETVETACGEE